MTVVVSLNLLFGEDESFKTIACIASPVFFDRQQIDGPAAGRSECSSPGFRARMPTLLRAFHLMTTPSQSHSVIL